MGEVYRARDIRLGRDVALKILPASCRVPTAWPASSRRSSSCVAQSSNIGTIYGFEDTADVHALVLELIDGPTLADTIGDRPMDTARILAIAEQMADALMAAHDKGITHRDIKPANVMLTARGDVKVLDFGLAKVSTHAARADAAATNVTQPGTTPGVAMGTVAYMSPEQASGRTTDHRTDCFRSVSCCIG
jgi:serine/threonine protein kinase